MLYSLYLMLFLLSFTPASDQTDTAKSMVSGSWHGTITQNDGGYRSSYKIDLILKEKDGIITGYSYVSVDDIYSRMTIEGTLANKLLFNARDVSIDENEIKPGMEWCMKNYILILKKEDSVWKLEGHWNGSTSFSTCTPGKVYLQKVIERA